MVRASLARSYSFVPSPLTGEGQGGGELFDFLDLKHRHLIPDDRETTAEGICLDLKFIALHPRGKPLSQVT